MSSRMGLWFKALENRALGQTDTEEQQLKKKLLVFASGLMCFGVMVWLALYWAMGVQFSATVPLAYQLVTVVSLAYYLWSGNFPAFRFSQLALFLFFPFAMQWAIGSYVTSSGVMLWALLAPVGAMVFHGWRESIAWFAAYLVLNLLSGFFDYYLATGRQAGMPADTIAVFFGLNFGAISIIVYMLFRFFVREGDSIRARLAREHALLLEEQDKSERLLLNVMPPEIAERLKRGETTIADGYADITVMFADIVNFTKLTEEMAPEQMVSLLNKVFSNFDFLVEKYGLEKIKTIGDAYMVAGGLAKEREGYVAAVADMALEMRELFNQHPAFRRQNMDLHIGIATGPVVAGVIGAKRFTFDLWGDTVNVASRLSSEGAAGRIWVDRTTYNRLRSLYEFEGPASVNVKGKGELMVYRLLQRVAAPARAAAE